MNLSTNLFKKNSGKQCYLHVKSDHPESLKKSVVQSNTVCQKSLFNKQRFRTVTIEVKYKRNYLSIIKQCLIQYIGKTETDFNVRMKNHPEDVYKADAIPVSRHFAMKDHIFSRDTSFFIIEQIHESTLSRKIKKNY